MIFNKNENNEKEIYASIKPTNFDLILEEGDEFFYEDNLSEKLGEFPLKDKASVARSKYKRHATSLDAIDTNSPIPQITKRLT